MKQIIGAVLIILVLITCAVWWEWYQFTECRHVGHSKFYCLMKG